MKYKYRSIPCNNLHVTSQGVIKPLCNFCESIDCTNNIEYKKISLYGINEKMRVVNKGFTYEMVIECDGFVPIGTMEKEDSEDFPLNPFQDNE